MPPPGHSLRPNHSRVTMKDVAERCGVSLSTVSLVLSGDARIPPSTTQRVLEVVKALGYRPNVVARNLARQSSKVLAVVLPDPSALVDHLFCAQALQGISAEASRLGYRLLVETATAQFLSRRFYLRLLKENSANAMIYLGSSLGDQFLADPELLEFPFLTMGGYLDNPAVSHLTIDNEAAGYLATKHLLQQGHRRIGHVAGSLRDATSRDRIRGYQRALQEARVDFDPDLVAEAHFRPQKSGPAAESLLSKGVTAIFAANDLMAAAVIHALKVSGRKAPGDMAVVGLGDLEWASFFDPPLSTIRYDVQALSSEGARCLIENIEHGQSDRVVQKKYPVELIIRESSGSPQRKSAPR